MKHIAFLTGTRADYGKIKPLILGLANNPDFKITLYVTGMHLLSEYGSTVRQILDDSLCEIKIFQNQNPDNKMEITVAKTIEAVSNILDNSKFDLFVVHGDRCEALAATIACTLKNIRVGHIEGGEISGTIDNSIRNAISKLAHIHFVANDLAAKRLVSMGEKQESIFEIGSPDIDIMNSKFLPDLQEVKDRYEIPFQEYSIFMFHPVTTELEEIPHQILSICDALEASNDNFIVIRSNNDYGSSIINDHLQRFSENYRFRFIPSMRFEFFLTLLKNSNYIIGNSSAGVREAPHFGVCCINIGSRQKSRISEDVPLIVNVEPDSDAILSVIQNVPSIKKFPISIFGTGRSSEKFNEILADKDFWNLSLDKIGY